VTAAALLATLSPPASAADLGGALIAGYRAQLSTPSDSAVAFGGALRVGHLRFELTAEPALGPGPDGILFVLVDRCAAVAEETSICAQEWDRLTLSGAGLVDWDLGAARISSGWTGGLHLRGGVAAAAYAPVRVEVVDDGLAEVASSRSGRVAFGPAVGVGLQGWWRTRVGVGADLRTALLQQRTPWIAEAGPPPLGFGLSWSAGLTASVALW
jgi:hypothetical protein